jgi:threonyl-tRNA synthetase
VADEVDQGVEESGSVFELEGAAGTQRVEVNQLLLFQDVAVVVFLQLSTRPDKHLGTIEQWDSSEAALTAALNKIGRPWTINKGDGAFYGPKIDIKVMDIFKRQHQLGTIQLDFNLPQRFNLQYKEKETEEEAKDGKEEGPQEPVDLKSLPEEERYAIIQKPKHGFKRPVIVHRAILGSLERCVALLCEQFKGKWPFWLSPRQIAVLPLSEKFEGYAEKVKNRLVLEGYFADCDASSLSLNKRIRTAVLERYNVILVVGEQEEKAKTVAIRYRDSDKVEHNIKISELLKILKEMKPKPSKPELQFRENALFGDDETH